MRIVARLRSLARPLFLAGGLLLLTAPGLMAAWVPALSGQIDDRAGVLGSGQADVQRAFDELKSGHRVTMWFVTMTTTDGQSIGDMAETAFTANDLGPGNMVLIVAVADRTWGYWDQATGISTSAIDGLLNTNAGPRFAVGDYAGGVIDFVTALGQRMSGSTATAQKTVQATAGGGGSTAGGGSIDNSGLASVLWITIGAIVILSGLILLMLGLRSRHREHLSVEERNKQTGDLARKSNTLLVDTDSAVHEAQQEVGFAEAEFDESDVKPYSDAVAAAQVELKAAFAIRQQLDDSIPEDQPTKEKMYGQIIAHCQTAGAMMDEQAKRLAGLRDLEKNAPETLAALPKTIEALQSRLPSVKKALDALSAYPPASWASVKGNAEEADKQGHFAETQIVKGQAALALTSPDKAAAARAARAAQEAVAKAGQLLDAVEQMATALDQARSRLKDESADTDADMAAAKAAAQTAPEGPGRTGWLASLADAEAQLKGAGTAADPIAALKAVQAAHAVADQILSGIRDAQAQQARAGSAYQTAHQFAAASIQQAASYVATRSDGVGAQARTRLSGAQQHLTKAEGLASTDLDSAAREATVAHQMADEARNLAQGDFAGFDQRGGRGGYRTPPAGYSAAGDSGLGIGGAILGGIIGGMISGAGNRRGGGFGGSPWGSGGGWTGGGSGRPGGSGGSGGFGGFGGGHGSSGGFGGGGGGGGGHGSSGGW